MEELFFGGLLCVAPVVILLVTVIRQYGRMSRVDAALAEHERALHALGNQTLALHQRVSELEAFAHAAATRGLEAAPATPAQHDGASIALTPTAVPREATEAERSVSTLSAPAQDDGGQRLEHELRSESHRGATSTDPTPTSVPTSDELALAARSAAVDQPGARVDSAAAAATATGMAATVGTASVATPQPVSPTGLTPDATTTGATGNVLGATGTPMPAPGQAADFGGFGGPPPPRGGGAGAPPKPPKKPIAWEEWIGVRGAAAAGGIVLVIAALYLFQYSMEHGLISPATRFMIAMGVGLFSICLAELKLQPKYDVAAGWLTGGGIAVIYTAAWAGRALYELYPTWLATILMVATTAACVAIAIKRNAPVIAILGLIGGFATPMALSTGSDQPIPLFGYLLVLNMAMLFVAVRQRWVWLAALSLSATVLYEAAWLIGRLDDERAWIGASVVALFGLLFALAPLGDVEGEPAWRRFRGFALVTAVALAAIMGLRSDLGANLGATAAQMLALATAAAVLSRRDGMSGFAAAGAVGLHLGLLGTALHHVEVWQAWALVGISVGVSALVHLATEWPERDADDSTESPRQRASLAAVASAAASLLLGFLWTNDQPELALPALALLVLPLVFIGRTSARFDGFTSLITAALPLAAFGVFRLYLGNIGSIGNVAAESAIEPTTMLGGLALLAYVAHLAGVLPGREAAKRAGDRGAAMVALVFGLGLPLAEPLSLIPSAPLQLAAFAITLAGVFAAARSGEGGWLIALAVVAAFQQGGFTLLSDHGHVPGLLSAAALSALFVASPLVFPRLGSSSWAWRAAGLAPLMLLLPVHAHYVEVFGEGTEGFIAIAMGFITLAGATALQQKQRGPTALGPELELSAKVWLIGATAALVTIAVPMQLENEWVTISWALEAVVFTALWRRYDHAGLKYTALALAAVVFVRLSVNPYVLGYSARGGMRVINWISYTYLVPAAALLGAHALMAPLEVARRRAWEPGPKGQPLVAPAFGAMGIALIFFWLNLMVIDFYAVGEFLEIPNDRMPARDLTISMVWALYAGALLAGGLVRRSKGLRYASLALLLMTCLKVFLYDLGNLEDLYRVASLAGLALTLIVISLVYRRFVFDDADDDPPPAEPGPPVGEPSPTPPAAPVVSEAERWSPQAPAEPATAEAHAEPTAEPTAEPPVEPTANPAAAAPLATAPHPGEAQAAEPEPATSTDTEPTPRDEPKEPS